MGNLVLDKIIAEFDDPHRRSSYLAPYLVRLITAVFVLLVLVVSRHSYWVSFNNTVFIVALAILLAGYGLLLLLYLFNKATAFLPNAALVWDLAAVTVAISVTDGFSSPFLILYLFPLAGSLVFGSLQRMLVLTMLTAVLFAAASIAGYFLWPGLPATPHDPLRVMETAQLRVTVSIICGIWFFLFLMVIAVIFNHRFVNYRILLHERENRLHQANAELTRSFYDLESVIDRARASRDQEQQAKKQLLEVERLTEVGKLAAGAIHDMVDPLSSLIAEGELILLRPDERQEKVREVVERMLTNANRLSRLVENMRMLVKPVQPPIFNLIDMHQLIMRCLVMMEAERKRQGVIINTDLSPRKSKILGIESKLEQMLINLLVNSIEALAGAPGHLTIRSRVSGEKLTMEIEDDGEGIVGENLHRIFEPFFTTRKDGQSLGLGLFSVRAIVEDHNGTINVRSEPGVSTVFTIEFPLANDTP